MDFTADFCQKGSLNLLVLKETSSFRKDTEGRWLYAQGEVDYDAQSVQLSDEEKQVRSHPLRSGLVSSAQLRCGHVRPGDVHACGGGCHLTRVCEAEPYGVGLAAGAE